MSRLAKATLVTLAFVILSLGSATVAQADTVTFTFTINGSATITSPPDSPIITFTSSGTGLVTPFGMVAYSATGRSLVIIDPMGQNPSTGGTVMFDFGGGNTFQSSPDEIFFFPPNALGEVAFTQNLTITGGTGIFTSAIGMTTANGIANLGTGAFTIVGSGTISAPGLTAIPEPMTLVLLVTGLAGVAVGARRGRRARHGEEA